MALTSDQIKNSSDYISPYQKVKYDIKIDFDAIRMDMESIERQLNKYRKAYASKKPALCGRCVHRKHWGYCWYNELWIFIRRHRG